MASAILLNVSCAAALAESHSAVFEGAAAWSESTFITLLSDTKVIALGSEGLLPQEAFGFVRLLGDEAELLTLCVIPACQEKGIGTDLLQQLMAHSAKRGCTHLWLDVAADNAPALALYHKLGFVEDGRRPKYYRRHDGIRTDAVLMSACIAGQAHPNTA